MPLNAAAIVVISMLFFIYFLYNYSFGFFNFIKCINVIMWKWRKSLLHTICFKIKHSNITVKNIKNMWEI